MFKKPKIILQHKICNHFIYSDRDPRDGKFLFCMDCCANQPVQEFEVLKDDTKKEAAR